MREFIIEKLKIELEKEEFVYALWLEGADSQDEVDEFSDIDFVADVEDSYEEHTLQKIESCLAKIDKLDFSREAPRPLDTLRYKIFHIEGTSEHLLIDVNIQSHSRQFKFIEGCPFESPLVLFDKKGVIKFRKLDELEIAEGIKVSLSATELAFFQRSKVKKSIKREEFLEALEYYRITVLEPLVRLLRIKYTPSIPDYGLVHISHHLPKDAIDRLEKLHQIGSFEDLEHAFLQAEKWGQELFLEIKNKFQ
jgi:hypothetical protein